LSIDWGLDIGASVRNLIKALHGASPAYNEITQMLFILPQRSLTLLKMYPEVMEKEDVVRELIGITYTEDGRVYPKGLGSFLAALYHELFRLLSHPEKRRRFLESAGLKEEEFKESDPLRAWIELSLEILSQINKDALKLLNITVSKLAGKKPDESVSWQDVRNAAGEIKFEEAKTHLKQFFLIPYSSEYYLYAHENPLLLDAYSDLRDKLKELLG
jgi:hypothetical protein